MKERVQNFAAQMVDADDKHKVHDEIERRIRTKEHQDAVIQHQTELMRIAVYIRLFATWSSRRAGTPLRH